MVIGKPELMILAFGIVVAVLVYWRRVVARKSRQEHQWHFRERRQRMKSSHLVLGLFVFLYAVGFVYHQSYIASQIECIDSVLPYSLLTPNGSLFFEGRAQLVMARWTLNPTNWYPNVSYPDVCMALATPAAKPTPHPDTL